VRRSLTMLALAATLGLAAACSDDGGTVRSDGGGSGSGSSASGSGLSGSDLGTQSTDAEVTAATKQYASYVQGQVTALRAATTKFTDAVRAGNVAEAKKQYAPSRVPWERIEPIAGLVPQIDGAVDARVDDFASVDDPKWTGWHKLEYLLWEKNTTAGGAALATKLDTDLATLDSRLKTIELTPKAVALGAGELIEEVSEGKITGEEERYSRTDLWDFGANVEGAKQAFTVFRPVLLERNQTLVTALDSGFTAIEKSLTPYKVATGGYRPYTALTPADRTTMQAQLASLSESLAKMPAALGVD
jgi:iron uptake system component EfeO